MLDTGSILLQNSFVLQYAPGKCKCLNGKLFSHCRSGEIVVLWMIASLKCELNEIDKLGDDKEFRLRVWRTITSFLVNVGSNFFLAKKLKRKLKSFGARKKIAV